MSEIRIYYVNSNGELFKLNDLEALLYDVSFNSKLMNYTIKVKLYLLNNKADIHYIIEKFVCEPKSKGIELAKEFIRYIYSSLERIYNHPNNEKIEILTYSDFITIKNAAELIR